MRTRRGDREVCLEGIGGHLKSRLRGMLKGDREAGLEGIEGRLRG